MSTSCPFESSLIKTIKLRVHLYSFPKFADTHTDGRKKNVTPKDSLRINARSLKRFNVISVRRSSEPLHRIFMYLCSNCGITRANIRILDNEGHSNVLLTSEYV